MSFLDRLKKDGWWKKDGVKPADISITEENKKELRENGYTIARDSDGAFVKISIINDEKKNNLENLTEDDISIEKLPIAAQPLSGVSIPIER